MMVKVIAVRSIIIFCRSWFYSRTSLVHHCWSSDKLWQEASEQENIRLPWTSHVIVQPVKQCQHKNYEVTVS